MTLRDHCQLIQKETEQGGVAHDRCLGSPKLPERIPSDYNNHVPLRVA